MCLLLWRATADLALPYLSPHRWSPLLKNQFTEQTDRASLTQFLCLGFALLGVGGVGGPHVVVLIAYAGASIEPRPLVGKS